MRWRVPLPIGLAACCLTVAACGGHAARRTPVSGAELTPASSAPGADWPSFGYDAQRSGVGPQLTGITAADVGSLRRRVVVLDGTVDSSPVELHGVGVGGRTRDMVVITTTYGRTIAIDPGTGSKLWEYTPADLRVYQGSAQITTASPVFDPDRAYLYAATPDGLIHKLSVGSGQEVRSGHWPARVTFDPRREKLPSALNIVGSSVLVTTGGYVGDAPTYEGHVVEIDRATGRVVAVWNAECSDRRYLLDPPSSCRADTRFGGSAIWARAGTVVEPGGRRILLATGNGPFNGSTDWGDSVLELSTDGLRLLHNWTPVNQARLSSGDTDLGSTAPAQLPPIGRYRLAVQAGKDGRLHLLDLDRLDGTTGPAGPRAGGELSEVRSPGSGGVFTAPVAWQHSGRTWLFVADDSGTAGYIAHGGLHPSLSVAWSNGNSGTSPVLAGGLLYVYDEHAGSIRIYEPARGREIAALPAAPGHWNSPIVAGGRVIVPTGNANDHSTVGRLFIYHLAGR